MKKGNKSKKEEVVEHNPNELGFYLEYEKNGFMSNYYIKPFIVDGIEYKTNGTKFLLYTLENTLAQSFTEHYFQSKKHEGKPLEERIRKAETPGEAKKMASNNRLTPDELEAWEKRKDEVMMTGLRAKFTQNEDLSISLKKTGDKIQ